MEGVGSGLELGEGVLDVPRWHPGMDAERPRVVARLGVPDGEPPDRRRRRAARAAARAPTAQTPAAERTAASSGAAAPASSLVTGLPLGRRWRALDELAENFRGDTLQGREHDALRCLGNRQEVAHRHDYATGGFRRRQTGRRVLDRDARDGIEAELLGGSAIRLGMRFAVHHHVAGDHGVERLRREVLDDHVDESLPRHRHEGAWHAAQLQSGEQLSRSWSPRDTLANQSSDAVGQLVDDLVGTQGHAAASAQDLGGIHQVEPDDRQGVVVRPTPAVAGDELVLAANPVRLGVDQRAVHVPQDGRRHRSHAGVARLILEPARSTSRSCPWGG